MTLWHENLLRIIAKIDAMMPSDEPANGGLMTYDELRAYLAEARAALTQIAHDEGGRYSAQGDTERLRLAGVESTCTSGPSGLARNWQAAARRKLAEAHDPAVPREVASNG